VGTAKGVAVVEQVVVVRQIQSRQPNGESLSEGFRQWGLAQVYFPHALPQNRLPQASWFLKHGHSCRSHQEFKSRAQCGFSQDFHNGKSDIAL